MDPQKDNKDSKEYDFKPHGPSEKIMLHPINAVVAPTPKRMKLQGIPSVTLVFDSKSYTTRDLSGGYEHPKWNDIFECDIGDTWEIKVVLWDYDESNKPVTIGEGRISVHDAKAKGKDCFWIDILDNKKKVAKIFFDSEYISPDSVDKAANVTMNPGFVVFGRSLSGLTQSNAYIGVNQESTTTRSRGDEGFGWN